MSSDTLALLGQIRDHFCLPAVPAAQLRVSACRGTSPVRAQPQHSECCTAAWGGHRIPTPADGFLAQLLQDRNTHGGQLKGLPSTFMEHLTDPCNLGSRRILDIRKDYSAQHMWRYELGVPSQAMGLRISLRPKALASSLLRSPSRRLLMVSTPNNQPFAGNPCNGRMPPSQPWQLPKGPIQILPDPPDW